MGDSKWQTYLCQIWVINLKKKKPIYLQEALGFGVLLQDSYTIMVKKFWFFMFFLDLSQKFPWHFLIRILTHTYININTSLHLVELNPVIKRKFLLLPQLWFFTLKKNLCIYYFLTVLNWQILNYNNRHLKQLFFLDFLLTSF